MDLPDLIAKAETDSLTEEEADLLIQGISASMAHWKEHDPERYIQFLRAIGDVFDQCATDLKAAQ